MRLCMICREELHDGDIVVAAVITQYHQLLSKVSYAVDVPQDCLGMAHRDCYEEEPDNDAAAD